jgi:carbon monoxide dehydrogenase subunit G
MPYEATVPVHRRLLWPAVKDPERLLGALPNAVVDASGTQGVAGRLRVRTREQTVTFRGVARIVEVVPASLRVSLEIEAVFGRTGGTVEGVIEIALRQSGSGTRVVVGGRLDVAPGAAPLPADSLDQALARVVQRWFAALAETSPANRADRTDDQSAPEPPRASEQRASLAVVRDVPMDGGSGSTAPAPAPLPPPTLPTPPVPAPPQPSAPEPPEPLRPLTTDDGSRTLPPAEPEPVAPTPLRLVAPPEDEDPQPEEDEPAQEPAAQPAAADEPEPDDIWSKLRDRGLPPWIPFLVGAACATVAGIGLALSALRRHRRRR